MLREALQISYFAKWLLGWRLSNPPADATFSRQIAAQAVYAVKILFSTQTNFPAIATKG
jgi:hypothetical protein